MCKNITLYGHLTVDRILIDFKETLSLGGIANVWSGLVSLDEGLNVNIQPLSIGHALILVDKKNNYRVGKGCLNIKEHKANPIDSDWNHISYVNQLNDVSFVPNLMGTISADITKEEPEKCIPILQYLDYLFIAKEDLFMNIEELASKVKGYVIMHHPTGSIFSNGKNTEEYNIPTDLYLSDVNVLGAGDYFASGFIHSMNSQKYNIRESVVNAHKVASSLIKQNLL